MPVTANVSSLVFRYSFFVDVERCCVDTSTRTRFNLNSRLVGLVTCTLNPTPTEMEPFPRHRFRMATVRPMTSRTKPAMFAGVAFVEARFTSSRSAKYLS